ncbi:YodC family protein [Flavobacterium oreochromis]|uniref:YodC family protein n=1 Tax=Flavobacterium oreochromis TaxID=2906078 RepID=UPI000B4DC35D|nr:DUF2158 domain-containing protein [Flavobacterium oreochromis]OWP78680.1 hypothetical protein BWG23_00910 [Flavobacterium oreochromis]
MTNKELKFKIGDVVELNSGSPKMTVFFLEMGLNPMTNKLDSYTGRVRCQWFEGNVLQKGYFAESTLKLSE